MTSHVLCKPNNFWATKNIKPLRREQKATNRSNFIGEATLGTEGIFIASKINSQVETSGSSWMDSNTSVDTDKCTEKTQILLQL